MTMVFLRTLVRSRKTWCVCFLFAAVPAAFLIRVLSLLLHFSQTNYPSLNHLQPGVAITMFAAPSSHPLDHATPSPASKVLGKCDMSQGDWVPDHAPPAYTNETCRYIQDTQNCMRNGRPDSRFLYWKWKPRGCEVLRGNALAFLRGMRGRKLAFVGDSIARNQMQSLLCMLDQVERATNIFHSDDDKTNHWFFPSYAFTLAVHWSPFLVQHSTSEINSTLNNDIMQLDLDVLDSTWLESMADIDFIVISSGQWYYKAAVYKEGGHIIGCHHCGASANGETIKEIGFFTAYRRAMRTVFKELGPKGRAVVLRTFAPDHFENGGWDTGGTCLRTVPGGVAITEMNWMMHEIEVTEFDKARAEAAGNCTLQLHLLDITELAQVRSDGHPGPYRNPNPYGKDSKEKEVQIDCLHWCLPGPIDTWNEMLMETLQRSLD